MDDDREAFEFAHALYMARQVDREAAQMIVHAAEAGLIQINKATALLMELSGQAAGFSALQWAFNSDGRRMFDGARLPAIR